MQEMMEWDEENSTGKIPTQECAWGMLEDKKEGILS